MGGVFDSAGDIGANSIASWCDTCPPLAEPELRTKNEEVSIEPNPNNGVFTLTLPSPSGEGVSFVEIYNMMGKQVASELHSKGGDKIRVNLSKEPNGIYLYRVVTSSGKLVGDGKFVIEK